jgi:hypothetical protein
MVDKPTLYFMKMEGCGACAQFEEQMFQRLIQDPEVRTVVALERVVFGRDAQGHEYSLDSEFPDFSARVQYAPYIWLGRAYDESSGYHLNPATMNNKALNLRQDGQEYRYRVNTTYPELKNWILQGARRLSGSSYRGRR